MAKFNPEIKIVTFAMSKREWYAGMALKIAAGTAFDESESVTHENLAKAAYEIADAMIKEGGKDGNE